MVSIEEYDIRNCFKTEKILLLISGFYPRRKKTLYATIVRLSMLTIAFLQLFSMIILIIVNYDDLSKILRALLFLITHITFISKLMLFQRHNKHMLTIEDILEDPVFYGFTQKQKSIIEKYNARAHKITYVYRFLCVMTLIFYAISPFIDDMDNGLPLPGWIPFDVTKNRFLYLTMYIFQNISINISCYNNSTIDIIDGMLLTIATALFDVLMDSFSAIDYTKEEAHKNVKRYIKFHIKLLSYINTIETIFNYGLLVQFLASCLVICLTGFQMIVVEQFGAELMTLILYFLVMTTQVAMYCWYGHDITIKHKELSTAVYMSNWYESSLSTRKLLFPVLEMTKQPVFLSGGKFFVLSLATLLSILKSSYSYFAVLQRLYSE